MEFHLQVKVLIESQATVISYLMKAKEFSIVKGGVVVVVINFIFWRLNKKIFLNWFRLKQQSKLHVKKGIFQHGLIKGNESW